MKKNIKKIVGVIACVTLLCTMTGCAMLDSAINDLKGSLIGNGYVIDTYDNYGNKVMTTTGDKINIEGNPVEGNPVETTSYDSSGDIITGYELSSIITINIDGKEIQSCGDTCIFEQKGLNAEVDFQQENIYSNTNGSIADNTSAKDIIERFGRPDVIWASPPCTSYSIAAISHHRKKNAETGSLDPVSDFAKLSDELVKHTLELIKELKPKYWFIENPRGGMRKMDFMQGLPRYTVTYCQYGDTRMKPTDIWTNHPNPQFKPMCHNGDPCHEKAPRGSKTGTQGLKGVVQRSVIPEELCLHIADICM